MRGLRLFAITALAVACTGVPDDDDPIDTDDPGPVTFARVQDEVLVPSCGGAGCHNPDSAKGDLNLEGPDAYGELLEAACADEQAFVEGLVRVAPGEPTESFLFLKVTDPRGMGDIMPPFGDGLSQAEIDLIEAWILDGAKR